jgi:hypothetical protein
LDAPAPPPPDPAPRRGPPRKSPWAAGLVTLAIAAIALTVVLVSRSGKEGASLPTDAQLAASAKAVGARHPELRLDAEPMSATDLAKVEAPGYVPSALWILEPVGMATTDRPMLRWLRVEGARAYDVRLEAAGREILRESTTDDHLAIPARREPLAVGTPYVLRVLANFAEPRLEAQTCRSEFTVLPIPHRAGWRSIVGDVESNEPAPIRDLLVAHLALRKGLLGEALRRADAWSLTHPGDPAGRPLLEALSRLFHLDAAPPPYTGFSSR